MFISLENFRSVEAALVSVPFVVIHGLPASRETRADLVIIKATQGRLFKAASESAIERIELGDRLVGPVVALTEQRAIDLAPAVVASSHTCKDTFRGIAADGGADRGAMSVDE